MERLQEVVKRVEGLEESEDVEIRVDGSEQDRATREVVGENKLVDPPSKRGIWYRSRLIAGPDGSVDSLLLALARRRYSDFNPKAHRPFWIDGNWMNETISNVGLVHLGGSRSKTGQGRKNQYGAPAGSKEYWKAYRIANKDKLKNYHRTRRQAAAMRTQELKELHSRLGAPPSETAALDTRLGEIFAMAGKPSVPERDTSSAAGDRTPTASDSAVAVGADSSETPSVPAGDTMDGRGVEGGVKHQSLLDRLADRSPNAVAVGDGQEDRPYSSIGPPAGEY